MSTTELRFPVLSHDDPEVEGVVATWYVLDGEPVLAGQVVAEVQVDKVANDLEAPVSGTLHVLVPEERSVRQGELIATIEG